MAKRSGQIASRNAEQIARAKSILRGNPKKLRLEFSKIRKLVDSNQLDTLAKEIYLQPFYQLKLFGSPFPRTYGSIKSNPPLFSASYDREFKWAASLISVNAEKIQRFVDLRDEISELVLDMKFEHAELLTRKLEAELGISLWSTSLRMYLIHEAFGGTAQQNYVKSLYNSPGIDGSSYYLAYYYSYRAKPSASLQQIRDAVSKTGTDSAIGTYLNFKLLPFIEPPSEALETVLRYEASSSIIDLYDTFIRASFLTLLNGDEIDCNSVKDASLILGDKINDRYLESLEFALGARDIYTETTNDQAALNFLNSFIQSGFALKSSQLGNLLQIALGKDCSELHNPPNRLIDDILHHFKNIWIRHESSEASLSHIERLCTNLSCFGWAHAIYHLVNRYWKASGTLDIFGPTIGGLYSTLKLPEISTLKGVNSKILLNSLLVHQPHSSAIACQYRLDVTDNADGCEPVDNEIAAHPLGDRLITAITSSRSGDHTTTIKALTPISDFKETVIELSAVALSIKANVATDQLEIASEMLAHHYIANELNWTALPVSDLAVILIKSKAYDRKNLAIPITLDIYAKHVLGGPLPARSYAVEDFWESFGVGRPSELPADASSNQEHLLYYLRNLCVPTVLEDSDAFLRSRDLEEERIRVCQRLLELDPNHADLYRDEIKKLTRRLVIYEGVKRIEQSKIYVDLAGIKSFLLDDISFDYARLTVALRDNVINTELLDINSKQMRVKGEDGADNIYLRFQRDSPGRIIATIMEKIWKEFARNGHYGLDVYLSTRIRHGTIVGHLRSPLEENNILCQKDLASGGYKENPYWVDKTSVEYYGNVELQNILKIFSARVDADLEDLKSQKLRVRTEETESGLFNFVISDRHVKAGYIYLVENPDCSASAFLDLCLNTLWVHLEKTLLLVRAELLGPFRQSWSKQILELRQQTQALSIPLVRAELDTCIVRAATALDIAIEKISDWFTLSASNQNPDFQLDLAVEIAAQSVMNCFGRSSIDVKVQTNDTPQLEGSALASFVDIFIIILENVVRHSRVGNAVIPVEFYINYDGGYYSLMVKNPLPSSISGSRMRERLNEIKSSLEDNSEDQKRLTREGGTGFHKLRKILGSDLDCAHTFDFAVEEGRNFLVTLLFDARRLMT